MMVDEFAVKASVNEAQEMIDMVFDLSGLFVPEDYPFLLWQEIVRLLPWLKDDESVGILPLRGSASGEDTLLSKRTKLVLRVPAECAVQTLSLSGQQLKVGESILLVGKGKERVLQPSVTLHSYMVESVLGEIEFIADMKKKLLSMNISCNLICDKSRKINSTKHSISGFGLVLHDLKPQASIEVQRSGLGGARHFGCGIFVPFKAISGLE
jgi:CRISPR-associated protein Cas6